MPDSRTADFALDANLTTGYRWVVDGIESGDAELRLVEGFPTYEPHGRGLGAGGVQRFRFQVLAPEAARVQATVRFRSEHVTGRAPHDPIRTLTVSLEPVQR